MTFTRYRGLYATNEGQPCELHEFITDLTTLNPLVEQLRNEPNKTQRDAIKKRLPGYCFNGYFSRRSNGGMESHSGMAIIDFDKIPAQEWQAIFNQVTALPYTIAAWRSPSADGIKALIRIPESTPKEHELRLRTFATYYGNRYMDLDTDVCRFCFVSYDPKPYVNEAAEVFTPMFSEEYFNQPGNEQRNITQAITDQQRILAIVARFKRSTSFTEGQRNKHTFNVASQFCEYGVDIDTALDYFAKHVWSADFAEEGVKAVRSAYKSRKAGSKQLEDRTSKPAEPIYPFEVFPDAIRESMFEVASELSLNPVFLATAGLWTVSSLAGTAFCSDFGQSVKNILFCIMIAPVSVGKTPAFKAMCEQPLKDLLEAEDAQFKAAMEEYNRQKADKDKHPIHPKRYHPFAVDGTTEGYIAICQDQPSGLGIYHDEAETIMNAGSFKSNNDSISFFTQAFSGGRYTQIRADRTKERVVPNLNINLLMGTQPNRLGNVFTMDKIDSGFASRFLMVQSDYIELNEEIDPFAQGRQMGQSWKDLLTHLYTVNKHYSSGEIPPVRLTLTEGAKSLYTALFRQGMREANQRRRTRIEQYIIGAEAKMSAYLPRLTQIVAIMDIITNGSGVYEITENHVELGYKLYKYYAQSTINILQSLHKVVETGLPQELENLYNALPEKFTFSESKIACKKVNLPDNKFRHSLRNKTFAALFRKVEHGTYEKVL